MNGSYTLVSEHLSYLTESSTSQLSFDEFIKDTGLDKQHTLKYFQTMISSFLGPVYSKRYEEKYGRLVNAVMLIFTNSSAYYSIAIIVENKMYSMATYLYYHTESKKFIWKKYYVLFKTSDGKHYTKVAEGDENQEFTSNDKYGNLLKIKNVLQHKDMSTAFKLRM